MDIARSKTLAAALLAVLVAGALLAGCTSSEETSSDSSSSQDSAAQDTASGDATSDAVMNEGPPEGWGDPDTWLLPSGEGVEPADFVDAIDNPYFPMIPGTKWVYEAQAEDGLEVIEIEVLEETREVMGVQATVVHDVVTLEGELVEDTYDWYAQDKDGNVWYLGEAVDNYEDGVVKDHDGSWEADVDGAVPGVVMWAEPRVGEAAYYQEYYEGEATDLGRDVATDGEASVPYGDFTELLVVEDWNPLDEEFVVERKYYANGIGVVMEEMIVGGDELVQLVEFMAP